MKNYNMTSTVKLEVESVDSITPHFNNGGKLNLSTSMTDYQKIQLVYQLWEELGDDTFKDSIEAQGVYKLIENK